MTKITIPALYAFIDKNGHIIVQDREVSNVGSDWELVFVASHRKFSQPQHYISVKNWNGTVLIQADVCLDDGSKKWVDHYGSSTMEEFNRLFNSKSKSMQSAFNKR